MTSTPARSKMQARLIASAPQLAAFAGGLVEWARKSGEDMPNALVELAHNAQDILAHVKGQGEPVRRSSGPSARTPQCRASKRGMRPRHPSPLTKLFARFAAIRGRMRTEEPRAIHLADYKAPDFHIETVKLDFALDPEATRVQRGWRSSRKTPGAPLVLHGEELKLVSLALDGRALGAGDYRLDDKSLTIAACAGPFRAGNGCEIAPAANTALEGLYQSGGMFCTQCEPEGFRHITWFLDRPDNLSVFTVRIEADKTQYPVLLSNGNRLDGGDA